MAQRILILFICFMMLQFGATGRKKRKTNDQNVKAPQIKPAKREYTVKLNETICLPCQLEIKYQKLADRILIAWFKDGYLIRREGSRYIHDPQKGCLLIDRINSYDHGTYKCSAHNRLGHVDAYRVLNVIDRLPVSIPPNLPTLNPPNTPYPFNPFKDTIGVIQSLERKSIAVGKRMKLRCLVKGDPTPQVTWLFNGKYLQKDSKYLIRPRTLSIVIRKFQESDAGNYTCVATNSAGRRRMTYLVKPKIKKKPFVPSPPVQMERLLVRKGNNVTLSCKAPENKIQYLIWSAPIKQNQRSGISRSGNIADELGSRNSLKIKKRHYLKNGMHVQISDLIEVTADHEGVYKCIALFYQQAQVVTVKTVEIVVVSGPPPKEEDEERNNGEGGFPLNIVLPAACVAFFLLLVFMCICFAFRQHKARQSKGLLRHIQQQQANNATSNEVSENEGTDMQILPMCNYDSLKKSTQKCNRSSSSSQTSTRSKRTNSNDSLRSNHLSLSSSLVIAPSQDNNIQNTGLNSSHQCSKENLPDTCSRLWRASSEDINSNKSSSKLHNNLQHKKTLSSCSSSQQDISSPYPARTLLLQRNSSLDIHCTHDDEDDRLLVDYQKRTKPLHSQVQYEGRIL